MKKERKKEKGNPIFICVKKKGDRVECVNKVWSLCSNFKKRMEIERKENQGESKSGNHNSVVGREENWKRKSVMRREVRGRKMTGKRKTGIGDSVESFLLLCFLGRACGVGGGDKFCPLAQ